MTLTVEAATSHNARIATKIDRELRQHLKDAAEKNATGQIQVLIQVRDGKAQRTAITPLAVEIS